MRVVSLIVVSSLWFGCSGDDPDPKTDSPAPTGDDDDDDDDTLPTVPIPTGDTGTEEVDPAVAAAEELYDPEHVAIVTIDMLDRDAENLAAETNDIFLLLEGEECLDEPWSGPFNWYVADIEVDGDAMPLSGIRKKGLIGSLSSEKPSVKIDFDEYTYGQSFRGLERLTLNNSVSDGTFVKQCLGYQLFAEAGLPAPRCSFAHVTWNDIDLGVYVNVEPLKKDFLRWAFDGDDDGDLYEGTLSDFRVGRTNTFEPDTNDTDPALGPIFAVRNALELGDDAAMLTALEAAIDMDQFYRFWAMEVLIGHVDGYAGNTNNFYVYKPEMSEQLVFIPWGIDATFWRTEAFGSDTTEVVLNNTALTRRLWDIPDQRQRYLDALQDLLDTVWDEDALLAEVDRMSALVEPYAVDDGGRSGLEVSYLRAFIMGRRAELEAAIAAEMPTFDTPLAESICLVENGMVQATFTTTWDTLEVKDPFTEGTSRLQGTIDTTPFDVTGGAIAGDNEGYATIGAITLLDAETVRYVAVELPLSALQEGVSIPLDGSPYVGIVADIDFLVSEDAYLTGTIWQGELILDTYTGAPGSPVSGTIQGTTYSGGPF